MFCRLFHFAHFKTLEVAKVLKKDIKRDPITVIYLIIWSKTFLFSGWDCILLQRYTPRSSSSLSGCAE